MSDAALRNAESMKNQLLDERKRLKDRVREIDARLAKAEEFIAAWHAFSSGRPEDAVDISESLNANISLTTKSVAKKTTGNSKKEDVAKGARGVIKIRGEPVSRSDLYKALIEHGYTINGADPEMVLSTMLWRMKDQVVRLRNGGYWLTERPYVPAGYDPNMEDLIGATDDSQPSLVD